MNITERDVPRAEYGHTVGFAHVYLAMPRPTSGLDAMVNFLSPSYR